MYARRAAPPYFTIGWVARTRKIVFIIESGGSARKRGSVVNREKRENGDENDESGKAKEI